MTVGRERTNGQEGRKTEKKVTFFLSGGENRHVPVFRGRGGVQLLYKKEEKMTVEGEKMKGEERASTTSIDHYEGKGRKPFY